MIETRDQAPKRPGCQSLIVGTRCPAPQIKKRPALLSAPPQLFLFLILNDKRQNPRKPGSEFQRNTLFYFKAHQAIRRLFRQELSLSLLGRRSSEEAQSGGLGRGQIKKQPLVLEGLGVIQGRKWTPIQRVSGEERNGDSDGDRAQRVSENPALIEDSPLVLCFFSPLNEMCAVQRRLSLCPAPKEINH